MTGRNRRAGRSTSRLVRRVLPVVVWLAAIWAVLELLPHAQRRAPVLGIVDVDRITVPAPVAGRIVKFVVGLHEQVTTGQLLALLDDEDLRLRLEAARQQLEVLRAEFDGRRQEMKFTEISQAAREAFQNSVETRRRTDAYEQALLDQLAVQAELEEARIRHAGATVEAARIVSLEQEGIASETLSVRLSTERDALARRVKDHEHLLVSHRTRTEQARSRLSELTGQVVERLPEEVLLASMRARIRVQEIELERVALEVSRLSIVAPGPGHVESLFGSEGQWVSQGQPIMTITDRSARRIRAYVSESLLDSFSASKAVRIQRMRRRGELRQAQVLSISPAVVAVPARLWRDPRIEEFAFEVVIQVEGDEAPGETVSLLM